MQPFDRLNLVLALLAIALAWRWFAIPEPIAGIAISELQAEQVNEIRGWRGAELQLDMLRDEAGWIITHPVITRARPERVATLLGLLKLRAARALPELPPSQVGLLQASATLEFDRQIWRFGAPSVPPGHRYLEVDGKLYLVDALAFQIANLPASHFAQQPNHED